MSTNFRGYQGIFFDEKTSKLLERMQRTPLADTVRDMHVTFKYGDLEKFPSELMNLDVEICLVGYASDGKNSGFIVELPRKMEEKFYKGNRPIHVTVSLGAVNGEKGKAVDTANLNFKPLKNPVTVTGKLGYFVFGCGKKMDNSFWND